MSASQADKNRYHGVSERHNGKETSAVIVTAFRSKTLGAYSRCVQTPFFAARRVPELSTSVLEVSIRRADIPVDASVVLVGLFFVARCAEACASGSRLATRPNRSPSEMQLRPGPAEGPEGKGLRENPINPVD